MASLNILFSAKSIKVVVCDLDDSQRIEVVRTLSRPLISVGDAAETAETLTALKSALSEAALETDIRTLECFSFLPEMATLDRASVLPKVRRADVTLVARNLYGQVFADARSYAIRCAVTEPTDNSNTIGSVYSSLCRRTTIRAYQRILGACGLPHAHILPYVAGVIASSGRPDVTVIYDEGDSVVKAVLAREGAPVTASLHYGGDEPLREAVLAVLAPMEHPSNSVVYLHGRMDDPFVREALKAQSVEVVERPALVSSGCSMDFAPTHRPLLSVAVALLLALALQCMVLNGWESGVQKRVSSLDGVAARLRAETDANAAASVLAAARERKTSRALRWVGVLNRLQAMSKRVALSSVHSGSITPARPDGQLAISGTGDIGSIVAFESDAKNAGFGGARLTSIVRKGDAFNFTLVAQWPID